MTKLSPQQRSRQEKQVANLLAIAQLGYAHWFFGNLYEAVVRVPERIAKDYKPGGEDGRLTSFLSPGSPVRYFLPGLPVIIWATVWVLLIGWRRPNNRPWLLSLAITALSGIAATAWLVRTVNVKLLIAGQALTPAEQDRLLQRWYRVNLFRLLTAAGSWLIAARLSSRFRSP